MKSLSFFSAIAITTVVATSQSYAASEAITVDVDLNTQRYINGVSELDRTKYFNVHSTYDAHSLSTENIELLYNELNVGLGRVFDSPFYYYGGDAPYPTREMSENLATYKKDRDKAHPNYKYRSRQVVVTEHPKFIFVPDEDPKLAADYAADFFELYYEDENRPLYYEPMNEPFVHADDFPGDENENRLKMAKYFAEIGREFDERGIDTKVVGYSSAWPSQELWDFGHWESRMKMFMDEAGDQMDALSLHLYDGLNVKGQENKRSGSNANAILDLIETYGFKIWGQPKPFALTEFGGIVKGWPKEYSPEKHSQEIRAVNHLLFGFFDRQDRIDIAVPFITTISPWYWSESDSYHPYVADLWRPDPDKVIEGVPTGHIATEKMYFYKLWSDVKGVRVKTASSDPDLYVQAFADQNTAYVCLNNLEETAREIDLSVLAPTKKTLSVTIKRLDIPENERASYTVETVKRGPSKLTLSAFETVIIAYEYAKPISFTDTVKAWEYYSHDFLHDIEADKPVQFSFNDVASANEQAMLRMSFARKHDKSKQPIVTLNGKTLTVPTDWPGYDQANRTDFFGAISIPVPTKLLQTNNVAEITFPDSGGQVSTVILCTESKL